MKKVFKSAYCELTVTKKLFKKEIRWHATWEDNDRNVEVMEGIIPSPSKSLISILKNNRNFYNVWYYFNPFRNEGSIRTL